MVDPLHLSGQIEIVKAFCFHYFYLRDWLLWIE